MNYFFCFFATESKEIEIENEKNSYPTDPCTVDDNHCLG